MLIEQAIDRADLLYPNSFTFSEKLNICYDLSCQIRNELKKIYGRATYSASSKVYLPKGVGLQDVTAVYLNGRSVTKKDFISAVAKGVPEGGTLEIVYLTRPSAYKDISLSDTCVTDGNMIYFTSMPSASVGDLLRLLTGQNAGYEGRILEVQPDCLVMSKDFTVSVTEAVTGELCPAWTTECAEPYDEMYIDYLLGKMMYYQQDFETANQYLSQFNTRWLSYANYIKERGAVGKKQFTGYF
ncbi:MAG: hypothetical protein Q8882_08980 [Bacillota bacterium]|nr:hypothetical protein [Bacillota bacterium]